MASREVTGQRDGLFTDMLASVLATAWPARSMNVSHRRVPNWQGMTVQELLHADMDCSSYRKIPGKWTVEGKWLSEVLALEATKGSRYIINLGAHFTGMNDAVSDHMKKAKAPWEAQGLAIDNDDPLTWVQPAISKHVGFATPDNIASILSKANVPESVLLLKTDIDSYDRDVTLAVLGIRRPFFVYVEVNEKVPVPVCMCNIYSRKHPWKRHSGPAYGCSLAAYVAALMPAYLLVSVVGADALFVRKDFAPAVEALFGRALPTSAEAWVCGYGRRPDRLTRFPWNRGEDPWNLVSNENKSAGWLFGRLHDTFDAGARPPKPVMEPLALDAQQFINGGKHRESHITGDSPNHLDKFGCTSPMPDRPVVAGRLGRHE